MQPKPILKKESKHKEEKLVLIKTLPSCQFPTFNETLIKYLIILVKTRKESIKFTLSKEVDSRKYIWREGSEKKAGEERIEFEFFTCGVFNLEISIKKTILRSYGIYVDKGKKTELKYFSYQSETGFFKNPEAMITDYITFEDDSQTIIYKKMKFFPDFSHYFYDKKLPYLVENEVHKLLLNAKYSFFIQNGKPRSYYFKNFLIKENRLNYQFVYLHITMTLDIFGIIEIKVFHNYTYHKNSIISLGTYTYAKNELVVNAIQNNGISTNFEMPYKEQTDEITYNNHYVMKNDYKKTFESFDIDDSVIQRFLEVTKNSKFSQRKLNLINFLLEKSKKKNFEENISFESYSKLDWDVNSSKITFYPEGVFYKLDWIAGKDYSFEDYFVGIYHCDNEFDNVKLIGFHSENSETNANDDNEYPEIIDVKGNLKDEEITCRIVMKKIFDINEIKGLGDISIISNVEN